jgi:hypothetical protein
VNKKIVLGTSGPPAYRGFKYDIIFLLLTKLSLRPSSSSQAFFIFSLFRLKINFSSNIWEFSFEINQIDLVVTPFSVKDQVWLG